MEGMQAYGAGKAGGAFDPVTFLQQPQTVLRIVSWLFSIVIFGCIANEGYINRPDEVEEYCIFNRNQNACNYGVFMGSMAFLCCVVFLALDVYFPQISSVKDRKKAVLADVAVSGGPVVPRLPEIQAGGRLRPLLPGLHRSQPGCSRSALHVLRRGRLGKPERRRGPGQQRRGLRRHWRLPASRLLRCRSADTLWEICRCPKKII
ncbi:synaptogyrin-1-like isoform X2 [Fundulus heteroclitus]|uniref:synaptogyrin-1-like isoform X2 n=1 Tax=Fundulus heteroclitus TaxID=8078 RepID=UPI00165C4D78|nr:synaptogyrin-1-like isoform X2 [Fundulus heteroclitus]